MAEREEKKDGKKTDSLSTELLVKRLRQNIALRLNDGETGLARALSELKKLEDQLAAEPPPTPAELDDFGLPERNKVKRTYTMSQAAREARQLNALKSTGPCTPDGKKKSAANGNNWKHGLYSQSVIRKTFGVCIGDRCGKYPCKPVDDGATCPGQLCLDNEGLPLKISTLLEAVEKDNIAGVKEIQATLLAMQMDLVERMILNVNDDGTVIFEDMFDKNGCFIGQRLKNHPNLAPIADMMHKMGISMPAMRMTPQELQKTKDAQNSGEVFSNALASAVSALNIAVKAPEDDGDDTDSP